MKLDKAVKKETLIVVVGALSVGVLFVLLFLVISLLVDAVIFDYTVPLGTLYGTVASVLNFFLMAISVQKALNAGEDAKKKIQLSYSFRMLLLVVLLGLGVYLPYFHWAGVLAGAFFPRVVIFVRGILLRRHPESDTVAELTDGGDAE